MRKLVFIGMVLALSSCSSKTGVDEKNMATDAFIGCDFYGAISYAKLAKEYAGDNVEISVPSLLIIGKSSEILGVESSAYSEIVSLVPRNFGGEKNRKLIY